MVIVSFGFEILRVVFYTLKESIQNKPAIDMTKIEAIESLYKALVGDSNIKNPSKKDALIQEISIFLKEYESKNNIIPAKA